MQENLLKTLMEPEALERRKISSLQNPDGKAKQFRIAEEQNT